MAPSHRTLFASLVFCSLNILVCASKENYVIYFRQGRDKVAVYVEMDLRTKVAYLSTMNPASRLSQTVSLYDYSTSYIAFKDAEQNVCYLEKMKDASFSYERRLLKSLTNQVLLEQADTLYAEDPPLTRSEVLNLAGGKILNFCGRAVKYSVHETPPGGRAKRAAVRTRSGHYQKTFSHHEHRSENYARFGHESTSYIPPLGSSKLTFIDPDKQSQPSAFQLAAIRHLKRRNEALRSFNKPVDGSFYGSGNSHAGQINTQIQSAFPGYSGLQANGQFALTNAAALGNYNPQTYSSNYAPQHHLGQNPNVYNNNDRQQVPVHHGFPAGQPNLETGLSAQSRVQLEKHKVQTGASSQGAFGNDNSKSQVQGSASKDASFQAQAQSSSIYGSSRSQTEGSNEGAQSSSSSQLQNVGLSEAHTHLTYNKSKAEASAQTSSQTGSISTHSHGGQQGGQASSQAKGPGETSSSARVGFNEEEETKAEPFYGVAEASAQGGISDGSSRTKVTGDHKGSIYSAVASGSYGHPVKHQGPVAVALPSGGERNHVGSNIEQVPGMGDNQESASSLQGGRPRLYPTYQPPQLPPKDHKQVFYPPSNHQPPAPPSYVYSPPSGGGYQQFPYYSQDSFSVPAKPQVIPQVQQRKPIHPLNWNSPTNGAQLPKENKQQIPIYPSKTHSFPSYQPNSGNKAQFPLMPSYQSNFNSKSFPQGSHTVPKVPAAQTHYIPRGVAQGVPAANGFRTRVVTSRVQGKGSFFPVFRARNVHQRPLPVSHHHLRHQNRNILTKTYPTHQIPRAAPSFWPVYSTAIPLGHQKPLRSECTSACFYGYRIIKTVKICKVSSYCQN